MSANCNIASQCNSTGRPTRGKDLKMAEHHRKALPIFAGLTFFCGLVIGAASASLYQTKEFAESLRMIKAIDIHRSEESALNAYVHEDPQVAVWAMEDHLANLRHHLSEGYPRDRLLFDMFLTHARLAKLYSLLSSEASQRKHIKEALEWANRQEEGPLAEASSKNDVMAILKRYDNAL